MMKVLIVDDSATMLEYMKISLKGAGINDILVATSGEEAIEIFKNNSNSIEMIFTDWNMPKMDGIDFIKKVREIDYSNYIYITMVTTECKKLKVIEALEAGADNYVVKPFSTKRIKQIIEEYKTSKEKELAS
jgi:two-component system chemotaxis response regulator CheY